MQLLVMVVDPDEERLQSRLDFFDQHNFRCLAARTGAEALETAANYRPHVVVLNEDLPEVQGTDVCLRIKQENETSHARIIVLGSDAAHQERFVSEEVGADAFVELSASDDTLLDTIQEILRRPMSDAE